MVEYIEVSTGDVQGKIMAYLVGCPVCGDKVSTDARFCPHCGETNPYDFTETHTPPLRVPCFACDSTGRREEEVDGFFGKKMKNVECIICKGTGIQVIYSSVGHYFEFRGRKLT